MFAARYVAGMLALALLTPLASFADAMCILSRMESMDSLRGVETLILARNLDLSYGAKERLFVSNDGTVKLRITRTVSQVSKSDLLASVYVNDKKVFVTIGQSSGSTMAVQSTNAIPDGRALNLMCYASPDRAPAPTPSN